MPEVPDWAFLFMMLFTYICGYISGKSNKGE